jgi:hypothetical protein
MLDKIASRAAAPPNALNTANAAAYVGMSPAWLKLMRQQGDPNGPPYCKIGARCVYLISDRWHRLEQALIGGHALAHDARVVCSAAGGAMRQACDREALWSPLLVVAPSSSGRHVHSNVPRLIGRGVALVNRLGSKLLTDWRVAPLARKLASAFWKENPCQTSQKNSPYPVPAG